MIDASFAQIYASVLAGTVSSYQNAQNVTLYDSHEMKMMRIRDKETNMMNRLERRREAIRLKWWERLKWYGLGAAVLFFAVPVVVKLSSLCWEWLLS